MKQAREINRHYNHLLTHRPQKDMAKGSENKLNLGCIECELFLQGSSTENEYTTRYM